jgi:hypothetical protein
MAHFAKIGVGNIVEEVIVVSNDVSTTEKAGEDFINNTFNTRNVWKQTSYNTRGGVHILDGVPYRKNYAGIGYSFDPQRDAFIPPKPFNSWTLNEDTCRWESPVAMPITELEDNQYYFWNESIINWEIKNR